MSPLTIADASRQLATKTVSPVELTRDCLERIAALNPMIAAFITVTGERALADARAAEDRMMKNRRYTPLDGIPIAHKDLFETAGILTTAHSRILEDYVPSTDATVVRRLADAGTVMLGKLATLEFALAGPSFDLPWPPARNPWNPDHFTSGSSSGTAAAVASGMIFGGTGTDTGGSIRGPAAMCGISGIKPTFGRCSRTGVIPLANSLDHIGPMAWTAEDCALLLQEMAGFDPSDRASADVPVPDFSRDIGKGLQGLKVGVVRHFHETDNPVSQETAAAISDSIEIFRAEGADVNEVRLSSLAEYSAANRIIMNAEAAAYHEQALKTRFLDFGERLRHRLLLASFLTSNDYIQAQRRRHELCDEFARTMETFDVLITAASASEAPLMEDVPFWDGLEKPSFTLPWNLTGYPAIAVCMGFGPKGLPLSVQIGGRPFDEGTLFKVACHLETATPWRTRRPIVRALGSCRANGC
ncbi:MAG: amidase [Shinella sp.]|uniref:amidase n=1 Tax=Shinella sp. TaxID=1870904 RepID=UPI004035787D